MPLPVIESEMKAMNAAAPYAPSSFHCRETIKPIRIAKGSAKIATPYTRYTRLDWVGVKTPTISEMDFSSATHSYRVINELVMTAARKIAANTSRRMSFVRRVSG